MPRNFRDIGAVCDAAIVTAEDCWQLWRKRQKRVGASSSYSRATLAVETHLKRIKLRRPLEGIADEGQRGEAEQTRSWYSEEFLDAVVD